LLEVCGRPHGRDRHLHGRLRESLSKPVASRPALPMATGSMVGRRLPHGVTTAVRWRGMPAGEGRRWSTRKGRVAGHGGRGAVRVRAATRGGDVVWRRLREKGPRVGIPYPAGGYGGGGGSCSTCSSWSEGSLCAS
jgi:hypothetical protein